MIITCEKCSTKFNLDESILKKEGSKVRCSICRHIFKAYPHYDEKFQSPELVQSPESLSLEKQPVVNQDFIKDDELKIDDDFTINNDFVLNSQTEVSPKIDVEDIEIPARGSGSSSKPTSSQVTISSGVIDTEDELDLNFSLDDDIEIPAQDSGLPSKPISSQVAADMGSDLDLDLDFDFSLDDDMDMVKPIEVVSSKSAHNPLDTNSSDLDLDFDFSLDDDMDIPAKVVEPSSKQSMASQAVDTDSGIELDMDFSLDEMELPPVQPSTTPLKDTSSFDLDDGIELELDFDFGKDIIPDAESSSNQSGDIDSVGELDMDFSTDEGELPVSDFANSNQELEIEVDDNSEFDFDFSSESGQDNNKKDTKSEYEAISPMDMEFAKDEELDSYDDVFDDDADSLTESDAQLLREDKPNLTKSQTQQTTLGGQPIIGINQQGSTLSANRPNPFEDSVLFEKKRAFGAGKIILILLVLILLGIGGYAASIMSGIKIPYLSDIDIKIPYMDKFISAPQEPIQLNPEQKTVSGKFVTNTMAGTLFIIKGEISNKSKVACKDIKVEGTLIAANKVKVKNKVVFCGNVIPEEQLKILDMNAINSTLYSSDGSKKFTVEPEQSIPFMIVFSDFPDNLENFTVAVIDFKQVNAKENKK